MWKSLKQGRVKGCGIIYSVIKAADAICFHNDSLMISCNYFHDYVEYFYLYFKY